MMVLLDLATVATVVVAPNRSRVTGLDAVCACVEDSHIVQVSDFCPTVLAAGGYDLA